MEIFRTAYVYVRNVYALHSAKRNNQTGVVSSTNATDASEERIRKIKDLKQRSKEYKLLCQTVNSL